MSVTILTPTYNRVHTLNRLYRSLENQSVKDFNWLIIDDGSTDGTKDYVRSISSESNLSINYIYKENGGKHTAINTGVNEISTDLTFIVDSDDFLTKDAVETILKKWSIYKNNESIGSLWFLQSDLDGAIIGNSFRKDEFISDYTTEMINSKIRGDKKAVYLTKIRKEIPFPRFEGETFLGEGLIHKKIGDSYKSVFINKVIYCCEYQEDGLTKSGRAMRIMNPKGGMELSKVFLDRNVRFDIRTKKMLLYITYGLFNKENPIDIIKKSEHTFLATSCFLFSLFMYLRWKK